MISLANLGRKAHRQARCTAQQGYGRPQLLDKVSHFRAARVDFGEQLAEMLAVKCLSRPFNFRSELHWRYFACLINVRASSGAL
jgi:hypothetical protein